MSGNPFEIRIKPIAGNIWGTKKPKKRQITQASKNFAWDNKSRTCNICGKRVTKLSEAEFDHTRAHSKSGATNLSNVKIVHRACNRLKGKKSLSETKKYLDIKSKTKKRKMTKKKASSNLKSKGNYWINPLTGRKETAPQFPPLFRL